MSEVCRRGGGGKKLSAAAWEPPPACFLFRFLNYLNFFFSGESGRERELGEARMLMLFKLLFAAKTNELKCFKSLNFKQNEAQT